MGPGWGREKKSCVGGLEFEKRGGAEGGVRGLLTEGKMELLDPVQGRSNFADRQGETPRTRGRLAVSSPTRKEKGRERADHIPRKEERTPSSGRRTSPRVNLLQTV